MSKPDPSVMAYVALKDATVELQATLAQLKEASRIAHAASAQVLESGSTLLPILTESTDEAIRTSMAHAFAGIAAPATARLEAAMTPVTQQLSATLKLAVQIETQIRNASRWFAVKWIALAAAGAAGVCLVAWAAVGVQRVELEQLTVQHTALAAEVQALQANVAALTKKGGRIKFSECGGRLCIEASRDQGRDMQNLGWVWSLPRTGQPLVIPEGY